MDAGDVERAVAAVTASATAFGLPSKRATVRHNSNKLALHLQPCDVFARVAWIGREIAATEIDIVQQLTAVDAPVARLAPGVTPKVHHCDDFAVTYWTHYDPSDAKPLSPGGFADALERLHTGMRDVAVDVPHFFDRVDEATQLVSDHDRTPALAASGRQLLLDTLGSARHEIERHGGAEQLIHGEPHEGNILSTRHGARFIDFETCCVGPVEFDVAHAPLDVSAHYVGLDHTLLSVSRRLVLAMVGAWRWDIDDEFPDGHRHGRAILELLEDGPPWPALGSLNSA